MQRYFAVVIPLSQQLQIDYMVLECINYGDMTQTISIVYNIKHK